MIRTLLLALALLSNFSAAFAAEVPAGFTPLFNDKDLTGWWGLSTEDPAKWRALSAEQFAEKKQKSLADIAKHWSVQNGELVNDGNGLYLTTDADYGDIDLKWELNLVQPDDNYVALSKRLGEGVWSLSGWYATLQRDRVLPIGVRRPAL